MSEDLKDYIKFNIVKREGMGPAYDESNDTFEGDIAEDYGKPVEVPLEEKKEEIEGLVRSLDESDLQLEAYQQIEMIRNMGIDAYMKAFRGKGAATEEHQTEGNSTYTLINGLSAAIEYSVKTSKARWERVSKAHDTRQEMLGRLEEAMESEENRNEEVVADARKFTKEFVPTNLFIALARKDEVAGRLAELPAQVEGELHRGNGRLLAGIAQQELENLLSIDLAKEDTEEVLSALEKVIDKESRENAETDIREDLEKTVKSLAFLVFGPGDAESFDISEMKAKVEDPDLADALDRVGTAIERSVYDDLLARSDDKAWKVGINKDRYDLTKHRCGEMYKRLGFDISGKDISKTPGIQLSDWDMPEGVDEQVRETFDAVRKRIDENLRNAIAAMSFSNVLDTAVYTLFDELSSASLKMADVVLLAEVDGESSGD